MTIRWASLVVNEVRRKNALDYGQEQLEKQHRLQKKIKKKFLFKYWNENGRGENSGIQAKVHLQVLVHLRHYPTDFEKRLFSVLLQKACLLYA